MILDEAIKHCEEKAKELRRKAIVDYENDKTTLPEFADCRECAQEHEQLAKWLEELQAFRKAIALGELVSIYGLDSVRSKGEWVIDDPTYSTWRCTNCTHVYTIPHNFCPNCGCDMRGKD